MSFLLCVFQWNMYFYFCRFLMKLFEIGSEILDLNVKVRWIWKFKKNIEKNVLWKLFAKMESSHNSQSKIIMDNKFSPLSLYSKAFAKMLGLLFAFFYNIFWKPMKEFQMINLNTGSFQVKTTQKVIWIF